MHYSIITVRHRAMTPPVNMSGFPTDNLYKFMALSGVFIVVSVFALSLLQLDQISRQRTDIALGKEALMWHTALFQEQIDELKKSNDPELQKKFDEGYKPLIEESLQLRRESDLADLATEYAERFRIVQSIILVLGIILASTGFLLWYYRLQRDQDQMIRNEALKK